MVDITEPLIGAEVPEYLFARMQKTVYSRMEIKEHQKGRLFYDGKFVKLLDEGTYYFWNNGVKVEVGLVDTRILQMNIQGQEMLTLDKVALRINFVCRYKIADYVRIYTEIDNYEEQLRVAAQLALREYIGHSRVDELLENKEQLADFVLTRLKSKESECFVSFLDAGVKDIILPGEIRDIMNTVLLAEKKAQANVITRREEVASTRSLLNTAKLMEENQTLMRLKEMEYLEKICDNVGNITVNGGSDLLGQLTAILKGGAA
jgi:regulator of protease activity HflC (stomatin/prohibitin superfamily)